MRRLFVVFGIILFFTGSWFLRAGTLAQFRSPLGDIEVELYDQDKPVTVQNFIRYIQSGAFQDEFAHRLVPGFVLQGGGFTITNRGTTNWTVLAIPSYPPITNEFAVGRRFSNVYGTIAMAKLGGDTNSATSQWYFNLTNNSFLDAADTNYLFVVFGHVVRGTNVLNAFNGFQYYNGTQTSNLVYQGEPPPFDTLPLLRASLVSDSSLVFIDITLLQVAVANLPGGAHQVSWNGPAGMTNVVEFTTNLPPVWNTLVQTNGTGARMSVTDVATEPNRFYRVRIPY
jgi:cyclophilin family peptidyl-prolyl cis-trans isomerase